MQDEAHSALLVEVVCERCRRRQLNDLAEDAHYYGCIQCNNPYARYALKLAA